MPLPIEQAEARPALAVGPRNRAAAAIEIAEGVMCSVAAGGIVAPLPSTARALRSLPATTGATSTVWPLSPTIFWPAEKITVEVVMTPFTSVSLIDLTER